MAGRPLTTLPAGTRRTPIGARLASVETGHLRRRDRHAAVTGVLLAFALGFAQTGAILHGYSHLKVSAELLSTPGVGTQPCQACCSFAPMLAAAGAKNHSLHIAPAPAGALCRTPTSPLLALSPRHAFLSRGPPSLA